MAIGMGKMIGLHYLENFNYPYISRTVTEFWRRWHMSLGTFFRDYVYIPMGGSRVSVPRAVLNTFVVWALTGLWHGASWNFVLWGLWFFVFLMIERLFLKRILENVPILSNIYLIVVVMLGWVIFRFTNLELGIALAKSLFGLNGNPLSDFLVSIEFDSHIYLLIVSVIAATPLVRILRFQVERRICENRTLYSIWQIIFYSVIPVVLLLLSTASLVGDSYNPFIYFQF
jgi:alginate O-acetyltransferase complex protein AlgI